MTGRDLWVFGYGSLMWRPGFVYEEAVPAVLPGVHRALCVYSIFYRGTPARPGLVLGLDVGGCCKGLAFRVSGDRARRTRAYLKGREQVTMVYREAVRPLRLDDGSGRAARALCFLADPRHPQYAGRLPIARQAQIVFRGRGRAGDNVDYVLNTIRHLTEMGIHEPALARLPSLMGVPRIAGGRGAQSSDQNDNGGPALSRLLPQAGPEKPY
ncbi:MAG: gamma-glutamylcyclotransferase [Hyphomicrobiales bacterium]|nr:gamma-glutamylcyclotransferase [Hyphomicrobiales bacterium]